MLSTCYTKRLINRITYCVRRYLHSKFSTDCLVLGIETSCDDTGCAIINGTGRILGESINSQTAVHVRYGGVNPLIAQQLHRDNIENVVIDAMSKAKVQFQDLDAIAVTVKPGLLISLEVGVKYANFISRIYKKQLIPIHHMEAHALTARIDNNIPFPYIVILISGGHCLLGIAKSVNHFLLLGQSLDNAPGEVMDKVARRMKLKNIQSYSQICGGKAIELCANKANNPDLFEFPLPLARNRDCNFSFSGLLDSSIRKLKKMEKEHGIIGDGIIPEVNDLCSAFQMAIAEHLVHRLQRAIMFCEKRKLIPEGSRNIVVSGGVACNNIIFNAIKVIGKKQGYTVHRPAPKLCTDNGVMIAWNGIEKLKSGVDKCMVNTLVSKDIDPNASFGENYVQEVINDNIATKVVRLRKYMSLE